MGMDTRERRKALQKEYKEKDEVGCVVLYENSANGRYLIQGEPNLKGAQSRFEFTKATDMPPHPRLREDWAACGGQAFSFTILDTLKKDPDQTLKEFREDLEGLAEMYRAKRDPKKTY